MAQQMKVFVSHSHQNNAFCAELVTALSGAGADVWYDDERLHTGRLGPTIERELRDRPVFIVVLSPAALASQWVEDETRWAYNRMRRDPTRILLPVLAEALPNDDDIWLFLQDFKRIEATGSKPLPRVQAIAQTLRALALTPSGAMPTMPQPAESVDEVIAHGKALAAQGKNTKSLPFFERATHLDPRNYSAWFNLAYTLGDLARYAEALVAWSRALALDPGNADAWYNRGFALGNLDRNEEALSAFEQAVVLGPELAPAWVGKAGTLVNLGHHDEALAASDRALALDPTDPVAWYNKGAALGALGHCDGAVAAFDQALALDPNDAVTLANKGWALRELGRMSEAEEVERRAREQRSKR